jgi:hypothetical protein
MLRLQDITSLIKDIPSIEKCLSIVDRKALDRETREDSSSSDQPSSTEEAQWVSCASANQFNHFQERCVEKTTSTAAIVLR